MKEIDPTVNKTHNAHRKMKRNNQPNSVLHTRRAVFKCQFPKRVGTTSEYFPQSQNIWKGTNAILKKEKKSFLKACMINGSQMMYKIDFLSMFLAPCTNYNTIIASIMGPHRQPNFFSLYYLCRVLYVSLAVIKSTMWKESTTYVSQNAVHSHRHITSLSAWRFTQILTKKFKKAWNWCNAPLVGCLMRKRWCVCIVYPGMKRFP